jgi:three-Cys-motif partner protein
VEREEIVNHAAEDAHVFGGDWTLVKLDIVDDYLQAWLIALSKQRFHKVYVDAFAGSGRVQLRNGTVTDGSAVRALRTRGFDRYLFVESDATRAQQLGNLINTSMLGEKCRVYNGDFNTAWRAIKPLLDHNNTRAVVFLDPYGLQLSWTVLEEIAASGHCDVWYLFPLAGMFRQAPKSANQLSEDKRAALTNMLGTVDWVREFYKPPRQGALFEEPALERDADWQTMLEWVERRLRGIFKAVATPLILRTESRAPLFALYFCCSSPNRNAQRIALRIANHLLNG